MKKVNEMALEAMEMLRELTDTGYTNFKKYGLDTDKDIVEKLSTVIAALAKQQEPVAWMHEWEDGERIPKLYPRDSRTTDKPIYVRPLVYADTGADLSVKENT